MIIHKWLAECDICGVTEEAKPGKGFRNDSFYSHYELPDGWSLSPDRKMLACPKCVRYLLALANEGD